MIASAPDTPAGARPALTAVRARLGLVALLFALAAVGWWSTADRMRGMDDGPWTALGTLGWFLGVWVVMMAAMMFPSLAPTVALYSRMAKDRVAPLLFTAGYLVTLGGRRVAAFAIARAGGAIAGDVLAWDRAGRWVAGATLLAAAAYELTPLKDVCLREVPQPARVPARRLARRPDRLAADGRPARRVVRRLLLGADGLAVRAGRHEHRLDGVRGGDHRGREDAAVASGRRLRDGGAPARARASAARRARCRSRRSRSPETIRCRTWSRWAPSQAGRAEGAALVQRQRRTTSARRGVARRGVREVSRAPTARACPPR